ADALTLEMAGRIADSVFDGDIALVTDSIAPFSGLAGSDLSGAITLTASGTLSPLIGGFDLTLDGTGTDLSIGEQISDSLLAGTGAPRGPAARGARAPPARLPGDPRAPPPPPPARGPRPPPPPGAGAARRPRTPAAPSPGASWPRPPPTPIWKAGR